MVAVVVAFRGISWRVVASVAQRTVGEDAHVVGASVEVDGTEWRDGRRNFDAVPEHGQPSPEGHASLLVFGSPEQQYDALIEQQVLAERLDHFHALLAQLFHGLVYVYFLVDPNPLHGHVQRYERARPPNPGTAVHNHGRAAVRLPFQLYQAHEID